MMSTTHCRCSNVATPAHLAVHPSLPAAAAAARVQRTLQLHGFLLSVGEGWPGGKGGDTHLVYLQPTGLLI